MFSYILRFFGLEEEPKIVERETRILITEQPRMQIIDKIIDKKINKKLINNQDNKELTY